MNKTIKYIFNVAFGATLIVVTLFMHSVNAHADSTNQYVIDTVNVINKSTAREVADLNGHELAAIKDSPKLYVYTTKSVHDINSEATQKLEGLDDSKHHTGIMILISKQNSQICVATGKGLEKALPSSWCNAYGINSNIRRNVKNGDYDKAVQMLSTRLVNRLSSKSDLVGVSTKKHKKSDSNVVTISFNHICIALLIIFGFLTYVAFALD